MAGGLLLHTTPGNKNAFKALIAAELVGVKVDVTPNFQMGVTNKTPEFLKLNPMGKIPVLETPEGAVAESNAIARYVVQMKNIALLGTTLIDMAHVNQWIDFASLEIDTAIGRWVYPRFGYAPYSAESEEFAKTALKRSLGGLDSYLATRTYLVGHSVTLADIITVCNLSQGYKTVFSEEFTAEFIHVDRYFWTLVNQPAFKKVMGEVKRCEREVPPPPTKGTVAAPPKQQQQQHQQQQPKRQSEKAPAPGKAKVAPAKKEETPAAAAAASAAEEEDEEAAPKSKAKNPLDLLPPSPMVIDNWKRLYSNTKAKDFAEVAIKGFWEMYDPEGYSLWFCDYKYNEENTVPFVTMNKVSGFLQRMDFIRKYAFSKMCILGEGPPYKIKGVWLFRGSEIPEQVKDECYDVELYDWAKADPTDAVHKERINAYFEEPDIIDGEKLLEAKCFK